MLDNQEKINVASQGFYKFLASFENRKLFLFNNDCQIFSIGVIKCMSAVSSEDKVYFSNRNLLGPIVVTD